MKVFPAGEITGNEKNAIERVQSGTLALTRVSSGAVGLFNFRFNVFGLPYLFDSPDHMWAFLNGPYGRKMLDDLQTSGLVGLCWYDGGARSFYAKTPLHGIDDLKGLRVRIHDNPVIMKMVQALGAIPVPMGTAQILKAFEADTINAAENNPPSLLSLKHYQEARYYLLDKHLRLPEVLVMGKANWDRLTPEKQAAIRRAAEESVAFQRSRWDQYEVEALNTLKASGVTVVEIKDFSPFKKAVQKLLAEEAPKHSETLKAVETARPRK